MTDDRRHRISSRDRAAQGALDVAASLPAAADPTGVCAVAMIAQTHATMATNERLDVIIDLLERRL